MNTPKPDVPPVCQCKYLRSKEMYYQGLNPEEDAFSSGVYWCSKTYEAFGPDGESADRTECCPGRSCYTL